MSHLQVYWTRNAQRSYNQNHDFVTENWGDSKARDFENRVDRAVRNLIQFPEIGQKFKDTRFRKLVVHENTSLFYRITPDSLKIILVWDNLQNPDNLLILLRE